MRADKFDTFGGKNKSWILLTFFDSFVRSWCFDNFLFQKQVSIMSFLDVAMGGFLMNTVDILD